MRRVLLVCVVLLLLPAPVAAAAPAPAAAPARAGTADAWPGQLEVVLRAAAGADVAADLAGVAGVLAARPAFPGVGDAALRRVLLVEVAPGTEAAVARTLAGRGDVASAAPVPLRRPTYEPNDPQRRSQWHLDRIGAARGWSVARGKGIGRVGVIDTQFDAGHPDLRAVLVRRDGRSGVEALEPGCAAATAGSDHGTFVAGIAGATTDNATGVASVGFALDVVAVQAGVELDGACLISPRWSRSLVQLADAGVPVVNLSFSGARASAAEAAAIRYATGRGTLVVAAAGNAGSAAPSYPAADPLVLAVAATEQGDRLWSRSNRGPWVDVAAPGVALLTTCPGGYCHVTGTSAAAPVVAGIAASLAAARPGLAGLQLRARVLDAALEVTGEALDAAVGHGRVRLDRTLLQRTVRLHGRDRLGTAAAVGREARPRAGTTRVVLVPADAPGDQGWTATLPAAGLLADRSTAMVMTTRDRLSPDAADELARLLDGPGEIVLAGSVAVGVSVAVEDELRRAGHRVERISGVDRAGTATALATEVVARSGASAVLVSRGDTFADALALAGPAAARGLPLVFVDRDGVPAATCSWLRTHRGITTVHLAGGTQAIARDVEEQLRDCAADLLPGRRQLTVTRDAGLDRVATSVAIARRHFGARAPSTVVLANGYRWPDAVMGGALAAATGAPVLLTAGRGAVEDLVRNHVAAGGTREAFVLGGPAVVSDATRASFEPAVG